MLRKRVLSIRDAESLCKRPHTTFGHQLSLWYPAVRRLRVGRIRAELTRHTYRSREQFVSRCTKRFLA
jgi:hypothetical protein